MFLRLHAPIALVFAAVLAPISWAVCPVSEICYTTSGTGSLNPSDFDVTYDSGDDVYDISIIAAGSASGFTIAITGANDIVIRNVVVKNTAASGTFVRVSFLGDDEDLARVVSVTKAPTSSGEVWVGMVSTTDGIGATSSPWGAIEVDKIEALLTAGDITAEIVAAGSGLANQNVAIGSITTTNGGDLRNHVTTETDGIGDIIVSGEIRHAGSPSTTVNIFSWGDIGEVRAAEMNAVIRTGVGNSGATVLARVEAAGGGGFNGDFAG